MDGATYLMDRPPGGWSDLATHRDIDALEARMNARFADIEASIDRRFAEVDRRFTALEANVEKISDKVDKINDKIEHAFRDQLRWLVGTMIGLGAVIVAALKF